jgi:proteasome lid subunit RPN8/RPN11
MNTLRLAPDLRAQIEREAKAAFPRECCGLIEGTRTHQATTANVLHPTRNLARELDRFEVDPADQFRILRAARANDAEVVGCYHSHPNGRAEPSERDRKSMGEEGFVWVIAALSDPGNARLAAFIVQAGQFAPIAIG